MTKKPTKRPTTRAAREAARIKEGRGRPRKIDGLKKASIVVSDHQYIWLKKQEDGISGTVRRLIDKEMGAKKNRR